MVYAETQQIIDEASDLTVEFVKHMKTLEKRINEIMSQPDFEASKKEVYKKRLRLIDLRIKTIGSLFNVDVPKVAKEIVELEKFLEPYNETRIEIDNNTKKTEGMYKNIVLLLIKAEIYERMHMAYDKVVAEKVEKENQKCREKEKEVFEKTHLTYKIYPITPEMLKFDTDWKTMANEEFEKAKKKIVFEGLDE
jgi:hypothetical protein